MPRIIKNTLLNHIPNNIETETNINPARIFELNNNPIKTGNIVYLCEREIRAKDNLHCNLPFKKAKN